MSERNEVKVRVPKELYLKMQGLKVLRGQGLSETVTRALRYYFDHEATDDVDDLLRDAEDVGTGDRGERHA